MASYNARIDIDVSVDKALSKIRSIEERISAIKKTAIDFKIERQQDVSNEIDKLGGSFKRLASITKGLTAAGGLGTLALILKDLQNVRGIGGAFSSALGPIQGLTNTLGAFTENAINAALAAPGLAVGLTAASVAAVAFAPQITRAAEDVLKLAKAGAQASAPLKSLLTLLGAASGTFGQQSFADTSRFIETYRRELFEASETVSELNRRKTALKANLDRFNSSSATAEKIAGKLVDVNARLNDELREQADLLRRASGVTVTELEATKGRKSIATKEKAEAFNTQQLEEQERVYEAIARLNERNGTALEQKLNIQRNITNLATLEAQRVQEAQFKGQSMRIPTPYRTAGSLGFPVALPEIAQDRKLRAQEQSREAAKTALEQQKTNSLLVQGVTSLRVQVAVAEQLNGVYDEIVRTLQVANNRQSQLFRARQNRQTRQALGGENLQRLERINELATNRVLQEQLKNKVALAGNAIRKNDFKTAQKIGDEIDALLKAEDQRIDRARRLLAFRKKERAELRKTRETRREKEKEALGSAIIGGAFPLLFGQGIGAAVGGGFGGGAGGLIGGQFGFGLSLIGTTLGSTFDEFNTKARDLSVALDTAGDSTQALESLLGRLDTTTSKQLSNLAASGQSAEAASLAFEELAKKIGRTSAYAVVKAGRDFDTLSNLWQQFTTNIGAGIAQLIQEAFYLNLDVDPKTGKPPQRGPSLTEEATRRGEILTAELAIAQQLTEATRASLDKDIEKVAIIEKTIAKKQADLDLAIAANELKDKLISKKDYEKKQAIIQEKLDRNLLDIEEKRTKAVEARGKAQDRAAQQAIREAERVQREQRNIAKAKAAAQINEINAIKTLFASSIALTEQRDGELAAVEQRLKQLDKERDGQLEILEIRYEEQAQTSKSIEEHNKLYDIYMLQYQTVVNTYETEKLRTQELKSQLETYGAMARLSAAAGFNVSGELAGAFVPRGAAGILGPGSGLTDFMTGAQLAPIIEQEVALARVLEKYQEIGQAAQLTSELVTTGFIEMVSGTKTVEQVFADFLNNLADMLMKAAQQMIAQYIAIGIARMFAMGQSASSVATGIGFNAVASFTGSGPISFAGLPIDAKANGGPVSGGTPYVVGERGPELFVPRSSGTIVPNDKMMGDSSNVVVNVDASGTKVQGDNNQASQLGKVIGAAVQAELIKQKRPGGLLAGT